MSSDKERRLVDMAPTAAELAQRAERGSVSEIGKLFDGRWCVFWEGRPVFDGKRIKRFESKQAASEFLALSLSLGKPATLPDKSDP